MTAPGLTTSTSSSRSNVPVETVSPCSTVVRVESMDHEWLREAIQFSLKAPIFTTGDDEFGPPQQRGPRFRKLVEGVLYSRRLILTYHIVIVGIIVTLSVVHWINQILRARRRRFSRTRILEADDAYEGDAAKSSSSRGRKFDQDIQPESSSRDSTVEGTASPPSKDADEDTPLLGKSQKPSRRSIISYFKAALMYQPPPIPFFNKILPSNGTSIVILAFIAVNVFYTFVHISFTISELLILADRCALVFVANLPLLYILAAKNQPLPILTGYSHESLNIFHRRLGELLCFEAILHTLSMFGVWYTLLGPAGFTLGQFLGNKIILLGIGAFFSYELLYFTSLASFRQKNYELFLGLHVALQAAALIFLFFHHSGSRAYVGIALAIFSIDRLVYRVGFKSITVEAKANVMEDDETVGLSLDIVKRLETLWSRYIGRSVKDGWQAADHVFLSTPSLARKHVIQAHPFTIASPAPPSGVDQTRLNLIIRAQDGFSLDLLKTARNHETFKIRLDGPYGSSHARNMLEDSELAIVVAGGSGIAVAWPLVYHCLDMTRSSDTEIVPTSSIRRQKIFLIWVVHKGSCISWIGRPALAEAENEGVEIIIPRATEEIGRPDLQSMIYDLVEEFGRGKKVGVVASGPDSLNRCVRNTSSNLKWAGKDINVSIEKFGW
jgi:hypothetical protein